jgi:SAM-dependent methyltransferase
MGLLRQFVRRAGVFDSDDARRINSARLDHLATFGLPIDGTRVLEVGAGVGLLTGFFEARGCRVLSTDGRSENVDEMRRRFPHRDVRHFDLDRDNDWTPLGRFDIVFCYGTLYHLAKPADALTALAAVSDMLLLETCLTPGSHTAVHLVRESSSSNQALGGIGCRPTRPWVMDHLRALWGHAYTSVTQPHHPDFETDWQLPYKHGNHRAVFVASRTPLSLSTLLTTLPDRQAQLNG